MVQTGAVAVGAQVELTREGQSGKQEVLSDDNGHFSFANLPPGHLFSSRLRRQVSQPSRTLEPCARESIIVPPIMLSIAAAVTEVKVEPRGRSGGGADQGTREATCARHHSKFLCHLPPRRSASGTEAKVPARLEVSYRSLHLRGCGRSCRNSAGTNQYGAYGQGAEGYAKRYGAAYAGVVTGTFIGSAILPSLLKQDPRYFYKGTGSTGITAALRAR